MSPWASFSSFSSWPLPVPTPPPPSSQHFLKVPLAGAGAGWQPMLLKVWPNYQLLGAPSFPPVLGLTALQGQGGRVWTSVKGAWGLQGPCAGSCPECLSSLTAPVQPSCPFLSSPVP